MNILPKKKWHVRTKENMARVRRDEAKAAEEEKARCERVKLAEHEDRINRLKARASTEYGPSPFDLRFTNNENENANSALPSTSTVKAIEHVNFFSELETQERQNLKDGNKEYQLEKKKEYNDWESKMGIMKRFAEDTKEYSKEKNWWENIPIIRESITDGLIGNHKKNITSNESELKNKLKIAPIMKQRIIENCTESLTDDAKKLLKKFAKKNKSEQLKKLEKKAKKKFKKEQKKSEKKKKRKKKSTQSDSDSNSDVSNKISIKNEEKIKALREERRRREFNEQRRVEELLNPKKKEAPTNNIGLNGGGGRGGLDDERKRKYNEQFNPEFTIR